STATSCAFQEQGKFPTALRLLSRQLDRPRPLPFGQRHFLKPTVRPLKLPNHIDLHNKWVRLVRQATEPIPAGSSRFLNGPLILGHAFVSVSPLSRVCYSLAGCQSTDVREASFIS